MSDMKLLGLMFSRTYAANSRMFNAGCLQSAQGDCRVFSNAIDHPEVEDLCKELEILFFKGENFGKNATRHFWWRRMLEFFSSTNADICFK